MWPFFAPFPDFMGGGGGGGGGGMAPGPLLPTPLTRNENITIAFIRGSECKSLRHYQLWEQLLLFVQTRSTITAKWVNIIDILLILWVIP